MSGGRFEYEQYKIGYIADCIESAIDNSGRAKTPEEIKDGFRTSEWYDEYPEDKFYYEYPADIITEFKNAVKYLRIAHIYANRIDWLLSGDDGEESFRRRLKEELKENS